MPERIWSDKLVSDLGAMFGYAYAVFHGQQSYRFASKGGKIERPAVCSTPLDTIFHNFSKTDLFVVSGISFADDPELTFCVQQYDDRRRQEGLGVSGFPDLVAAPIEVAAAGHRIWLTLGKLPSELRFSIQIDLGRRPNNRMVIETGSYLASPVNADAQYHVFDAFPEECKSRLGFDPKTLGDLCDALAMTLYHEACYDRFLPIVGGRGLVYHCDLSSDARRKTAPRIIHAINGKAIVVFIESHFVEKISKKLLQRGYNLRDARTLSSTFVKRFCGIPEIAHSLEPVLFVPLTGKRLGVDLLLMQEYHELCRRIVLSSDGTTGDRKGAIFEQQARSFIIRELNVSNGDIPIEPNTEMRKLVPGPIDYGDVDFAFMIGTTLVHLDMKSSCRRPDEFRGDYHAIAQRAGGLRKKILERVEPRGRRLAEYLRGRGVKIEAVLDFLCVGVAEYIPPGFPELRYGEIPRAVTPREIVSIIRDGIAVGAST